MLIQRQETRTGNSWLRKKSLESSELENMDDYTEILQIPLNIIFAVGSKANYL